MDEENLTQEEAERSKWNSLKNIQVPEKLFEDSLEVLGNVEENIFYNDLVNWEERKTLEKTKSN